MIVKRLSELAKRHKELLEQSASLDFKNKDYKTTLIELQKTREPYELFERYEKTEGEIKDCEEMLASDERGLVDMATEELKKLSLEKEETLSLVKDFFLSGNNQDAGNAILEIRAGTGGEEASLFAWDLFRAYSYFAEKKNFQLEVLHSSTSDMKGFKEVIASIEGKDVYKCFKHETGVHRVQRIPETESSGRIHTSTITVAVLLEVKEEEIEINESDLKIDTYRSSGSGGQHVNTTDSAVRITHLPTGVVVTCQDEKSQIKNRAKAMKVLRARVYEQTAHKQKEEQDLLRKQQVGSGKRAEKIRTYNFPQGRITDHRIGKTIHKIDAFMKGDLDEMLEALMGAAEAKVLENGEATI